MTKPMPSPLFLRLILSLPASHLRLCLILSSFLVLFVLSVRLFLSLSLYITQGDVIFPLSKRKEKHHGDVQPRLAVKSLEHLPPFREILIEKPGSRGTTNKLEMCKVEMNLGAIGYATTSSFLK